VEIKDLTGFSKPITKLIETVSAGVGVLYEPRRIRERAKAEADARVTQAHGEADAAEVLTDARSRMMAREVRRQRNLDQITDHAERELPASVNSNPVDQDWFAEFLNCSQDVSNEDMQSLWGRILAGEVARPGSFARRTLSAVRLLDRRDAESFTKLGSLFWRIGVDYIHFRPKESEHAQAFLESVGLKWGDLLHFAAIGLVAQVPGTTVVTFSFNPGRPEVLDYFGKKFEVRASEQSGSVATNVMPLTDVGSELARICGAQPRPDYMQATLAYLKDSMLTIREIS
jgi:hypothetical protein